MGSALGDVDADGTADAVARLVGESPEVGIFLGPLTGTLSPDEASGCAATIGGHFTYTPSTIADVDGDGAADLLVTDAGPDVAIHLGAERAAWSEISRTLPTSAPYEVADFDGDGLVDVWGGNRCFTAGPLALAPETSCPGIFYCNDTAHVDVDGESRQTTSTPTVRSTWWYRGRNRIPSASRRGGSCGARCCRRYAVAGRSQSAIATVGSVTRRIQRGITKRPESTTKRVNCRCWCA